MSASSSLPFSPSSSSPSSVVLPLAASSLPLLVPSPIQMPLTHTMPVSLPLPIPRTSPVASSSSSRVARPSRSHDKVKKRLARKAELARASRRRKKAFVTELQDRVHQLTDLVNELQRANQLGVPFVSSLQFPLVVPAPQSQGGKGKGGKDSDDDSMDDDSDGHMSGQSHEEKEGRRVASDLSPFNDDVERAFKCFYRGDARRFSLTGKAFTFQQLCATLKKIYTSLSGNFVVHYIDEEEDRIGVSTTSELAEAYKLNCPDNKTTTLLKLFIEDAKRKDTDSHDDRARKAKSRKRSRSSDSSRSSASQSSESAASESEAHEEKENKKAARLSSSVKRTASVPPPLPVSSDPLALFVDLIDQGNSANRISLAVPANASFAFLRSQFVPVLHTKTDDFQFFYNNSAIPLSDEVELLHGRHVRSGDLLQFIHKSVVSNYPSVKNIPIQRREPSFSSLSTLAALAEI